MYADTFTELPPIDIRHISNEIFENVKIWKPQDLEIDDKAADWSNEAAGEVKELQNKEAFLEDKEGISNYMYLL